ncbi:H-NS histone family protein [Pseudomonas veronii]|uniref:H-NS histone family protein n=1 Tax=Pseudomonas veronii TaxID=76761 RepID=A0A4P7YC26_PSEVE|nr:H-NS histone family protein [Pseudomonas veronii]QCG68240.1 H-NS histone family protein [Pseudomonas veronii]
MSIELQELSAKELKTLIASAQDLLVKGERERIKSVREKIVQLLKDEGLMLEQVFPAAKRSASVRASVKSKYVHPEDTSLTWTGRGMQPKWFKEALASGKTAEQLLLVPPTSAGTNQVIASARPARKVAAKTGPRKSGTAKSRQAK